MAGTVTVANKSPNGYVLRLFKMQEMHEPVMGGGSRKYEQAIDTGRRVTLHGVATAFGAAPKGPMASGFALTHNVDADFWTEWLSQNKEHEAIKAGLIFAFAKPADAEAKAREMTKVRSGLEPIEPESIDASGNVTSRDPRMSKRLSTAAAA